ncbi:MAG TPA: dihydroorotase [Alphaproteobacteria bacterium]|nr:dihydroorotase [Alphaproteobacteria bacterium]
MSIPPGLRPGRTAYVNVRLLDPASGLDAMGALLTEGEAVADFGPRLLNDGIPEGVQVIDGRGACLAPGLVDMRVQLCEPGEEHKETLQSGSEAAAAGGVTAVVALPNTAPVIDDVSGIEFIARRAREVKLVKVYSHAAVTKGLAGKELAEIGLLKEAGALAFTDGLKPVASSLVLRRALSYARTFAALIIQRPEEPELGEGGAMNEGEVATRLGLPGIPRLAEVMLLERDLRLVELTGGRYHAGPLSTAEGVAAMRAAKARGLAVTCDTAPHYFTLDESAVGDYRTFAKVSPPLRRPEDIAALIAGLADGTIDVIASDHSPQDQDSKRQPFVQAAAGIIGLETLLPLSLALYHRGRLGLLAALAPLTHKPAALLGLAAGRLQKGAAADLVLFDPTASWTVEERRFRSKSKNSPFAEREVQGKVLRTIVDGRPVFGNGEKDARR